jgi:hypothetical protein
VSTAEQTAFSPLSWTLLAIPAIAASAWPVYISSKLVSILPFSYLAAPIRVERRKKGKRKPNAFIDDRGHPDWQSSYDWLLEGNVGQVLRKKMHPLPSTPDPNFAIPFDESLHGEYLRESLDISHLDDSKQDQVLSIIKKYWGVFNPDGVTIPVADYECHIDTGTAAPVRVKTSNMDQTRAK